jgi:hypothetical protein
VIWKQCFDIIFRAESSFFGDIRFGYVPQTLQFLQGFSVDLFSETFFFRPR